MKVQIPKSVRTGRRAIAGATLLEVLVAILILSIGLLGVAGLQAASLRFAQGSWARAGVASALSSLAERVRSNPDSSTTAYLLGASYAAQRTAIDASSLTSAKNCDSEVCDPAQLAEFQMVGWRLAMDASLPGAAGFVTGDRATGYQATIMWFDRSYTTKSAAVEALVTSAAKQCAGTETGIAERTCCPAAANAPAGVRCTNFTVVP